VIGLRANLGCDNIFMGSDVDYSYLQATFEQILSLDHDFPSQTVAILHGPYDWELNAAEGVRDAAEAAGWEVVLEEEVPYDNRQWSGIIRRINEADPALVVFELLDTAGTSTFIDQFQQNPAENALLYAGYIFSTPAFQEIIADGGAQGVLGMTVSAHLPGERGDAFAEAWQAKYDAAPPFSIGAAIYDELMLWAEAVRRVGSVDDYEAINETIRTMDYEGVTGTYRFNDDQYVSLGDDTLPSHLLQAQGDSHVQLFIGSEKNAEFVPPAWLAD
jgi:ABC-type branched-subunit amino acid transport system substrate-binding protein